jgi:CRP/FNR family cyclic AMP-dependent transcriptional regulator
MISNKELRKFAIFKDLSDAELENITEMAKLENYEANKRIFEEKSWANNLYLVVKGRVVINMKGDKEGEPLQIDEADPGDIFGWSAVTEPHAFTAAAWTKENSEILVLNGKVLLDLFKKNNHIGYKVMSQVASVISSRLRKLNKKLANSR